MYTDNDNQWSKITQLNKAAAEILQRTTQQNLELIGENFSRTSEQLKRLTSIRKPEDFLSIQKECFNENLTAGFETIQKIIQTSMQNMEEFTKLCSATRENAPVKNDRPAKQ